MPPKKILLWCLVRAVEGNELTPGGSLQGCCLPAACCRGGQDGRERQCQTPLLPLLRTDEVVGAHTRSPCSWRGLFGFFNARI